MIMKNKIRNEIQINNNKNKIEWNTEQITRIKVKMKIK